MLLVLAFVIVMTGVDPVMLTEYAVIFSVVALPLTYLPILLVANDRAYMGDHATAGSRTSRRLYLVVILVVAVAAIPLMLLTNVGQIMSDDRSRPRASSTTSCRLRRAPLRQRRRPRARAAEGGGGRGDPLGPG